MNEDDSDKESDENFLETVKDNAADLPQDSSKSIRPIVKLLHSPEILDSNAQQDMDMKAIPDRDNKPEIPETEFNSTLPSSPLEKNGTDLEQDHNDENPTVEKNVSTSTSSRAHKSRQQPQE
ncbi:hypothetical protein DID88_000459 [Monilinia fructigena]|uniref:Uncharacterized protein n=1 Tax=Monilinia fructigena TaxID=38457 RepID=A0A395IHX8_9HELO|nr:hypothetical protein DID88_000459 [Monilinia fructigena]